MAAETRKTAGFQGISSFGLHILAMALMLCDHLWATLIPGNVWMTCLGRLAFPIFAFLLSEGFCHTRDRKKYALRLLTAAVISEIPFDLMYEGAWLFLFHQNVMWTLLLSLLCLWAMERVRQKGKLWLTLLGWTGIALAGALLGTVLSLDYYGAGVLTVLIFYVFRGESWTRRLGQLAGLWWVNCALIGGMAFPVELFGLSLEIPKQSFALLALIPIWLYCGRQEPHSPAIRTACYLFYPVHMLALVGAAALIG